MLLDSTTYKPQTTNRKFPLIRHPELTLQRHPEFISGSIGWGNVVSESINNRVVISKFKLCYTSVMFDFKEITYRWLPVFLWGFLIFLFSSLPTIETSEIFWWDFILKKTAHIIEYGVLFYFLVRAQKQKVNWFLTFAFCIFYGVTDEYHQSFVPGRTAALQDIGFDTLGTLMSFLKIRKWYG